jgi:ATP-binding cassette subfamily B protein
MIWDLMRGQRLRYGGAVLALVLGSCSMYLVPLIPQIALDGVLGSPDAEGSRLTTWAVETFGGREFLRANLWGFGAAILLVTAVAGVFTYLRGRWSATASEGICRDLRDRLYGHLERLPCRYHDNASTGDLVQRCSSDVETFRQFLAAQAVEIGRAVFMMLVPIPLMLALSVKMTIVSVVIIPPIFLFSFIYFRRVRHAFLLTDEAEGRLTATVQENLTGIRVVRAFARQEFENDKLAAKNAEHRDLDYRLYRLMATYWSVSDLMCMGQKALVLGAGGYWLATGQLQVGTFYFFLAAVNMFVWPMRMMGRILTQLGKATVAIGRIGEIIDHPVESLPDEPTALPEPVEGGLVFQNVTFSHGDSDGNTYVDSDGTERHTLDDVSFEAEPGQTVALLGPSGAGKSTIVSLILRFYDPQSGAIRLDDVDIARLPREDVRRQIAVVMQEPFLYSKSVGENVRLGRSSADHDEIVGATSVAAVHESIEQFDEGYDTLVGERGVTLSGGQRQRVALARALLDEPALLILDDALSAVDTDTEGLILDALRARAGRCTTLLIAHRLSTLLHADKILVIDEGRIVQEGTHDTLSREPGMYRRLWRIQSAHAAALEEDLAKEQPAQVTANESVGEPAGGPAGRKEADDVRLRTS